MSVRRAILRVLIEKIFSWAGRKFFLGREQFLARERIIVRSLRCSRVVGNFRGFANGKRYSVTGVTAKRVEWASRGPAPHFIIFSRKKVAICLLISLKLCNFAADITKNGEEMMNLNLINSLIIIRLRSVAGGDKVCI